MSNALTVILGWIEEARADEDRTAVEGALEVIEKRSRAARDLARRAIGVAVTVVEEYETLEEAVKDTVHSLEVEARQAGVTLDLVSSTPGGQLLGASELAQVLGNLLLNAIAFTPAKGIVRVTTSQEAERLFVDVIDEGPGVEDDRRDSIFQGDSTRKGGAGVGLGYARDVARQNGGDVILMANLPHAAFRISWPRSGTSRRPPQRISLPPKSRGALATVRLLVLDDDRDITDLLETALTSRGAALSVIRKSSELEGVDGEFDAILLDYSPIADSVDTALETIKRRWPAAALLVISGTVSVRALPGIPQPSWVRKPFEVAELVGAIQRVLGRSEPVL